MSDDQFTKLSQQLTGLSGQISVLNQRVSGLDQKVTSLDQKVAGLDQKITMLDQKIDGVNDSLSESILKLYQHTEEQFSEIRSELDQKADKEDVYRSLDSILKRLDEDAAERAAANRQLARHEAWHHQTADHLHLKLDYNATI